MPKKLQDDDLIEELQRLGDELGQTPRAPQMNEHGRYDATTYVNHFGSWNEALESAGFEPRNQGSELSEVELIDELQRLADELGSKPTFKEMEEHGKYSSVTYLNRFGSWNEALEAAGYGLRSNKIPTDHLIDDLQRASEIVTDRLTAAKYDEVGEYSSQTISRRFGSWNDGLDAAGLS